MSKVVLIELGILSWAIDHATWILGRWFVDWCIQRLHSNEMSFNQSIHRFPFNTLLYGFFEQYFYHHWNCSCPLTKVAKVALFRPLSLKVFIRTIAKRNNVEIRFDMNLGNISSPPTHSVSVRIEDLRQIWYLLL